MNQTNQNPSSSMANRTSPGVVVRKAAAATGAVGSGVSGAFATGIGTPMHGGAFNPPQRLTGITSPFTTRYASLQKCICR
jgi:hypothetical protein